MNEVFHKSSMIFFSYFKIEFFFHFLLFIHISRKKQCYFLFLYFLFKLILLLCVDKYHLGDIKTCLIQGMLLIKVADSGFDRVAPHPSFGLLLCDCFHKQLWKTYFRCRYHRLLSNLSLIRIYFLLWNYRFLSAYQRSAAVALITY